MKLNKGDTVKFKYEIHKVGTVYKGVVTSIDGDVIYISTNIGKYIVKRDAILGDEE